MKIKFTSFFFARLDSKKVGETELYCRKIETNKQTNRIRDTREICSLKTLQIGQDTEMKTN